MPQTTRLGEEVDDVGIDNDIPDGEYEGKSIHEKWCKNGSVEYLVRWEMFKHEHGSGEPSYNFVHSHAWIAKFERVNK